MGHPELITEETMNRLSNHVKTSELIAFFLEKVQEYEPMYSDMFNMRFGLQGYDRHSHSAIAQKYSQHQNTVSRLLSTMIAEIGAEAKAHFKAQGEPPDAAELKILFALNKGAGRN